MATPPGVVADEHRPPARRHVLVPVARDVEVAAVQQRKRGEEPAEVLARDAERVDAVLVERELEAVEAPGDLVVDQERQVARSVGSRTLPHSGGQQE